MKRKNEKKEGKRKKEKRNFQPQQGCVGSSGMNISRG
jgi:hypothetical protein